MTNKNTLEFKVWEGSAPTSAPIFDSGKVTVTPGTIDKTTNDILVAVSGLTSQAIQITNIKTVDVPVVYDTAETNSKTTNTFDKIVLTNTTKQAVGFLSNVGYNSTTVEFDFTSKNFFGLNPAANIEIISRLDPSNKQGMGMVIGNTSDESTVAYKSEKNPNQRGSSIGYFFGDAKRRVTKGASGVWGPNLEDNTSYKIQLYTKFFVDVSGEQKKHTRYTIWQYQNNTTRVIYESGLSTNDPGVLLDITKASIGFYVPSATSGDWSIEISKLKVTRE
jgi:hypothetical protein